MNSIHRIALLFAVYAMSCNGQAKNNTTKDKITDADVSYHWQEITKNAAFPKAYNFQIFSIRDTLWVMHQAGTWFSLEGRAWTKSPLTNVLKGNAFLDYVWFKNALYAIGTFEGNVEHYQFTSAIHRTTDMKTWETLATESNLPKRFFYHPFVFKDKIWIVGGNDGRNDFDGTGNFSDIWNSSDGITWRKQADHLPFGNRDQSQFVLFKDVVYMLNNDVWSSGDGINWTKVVDRLAKENIFGYASVVYDKRIWLLGCNRDGSFQSQVLVSKDGKTWETKAAPWTPRGAATACVHKGKILITGGKYGGTSKDGRTTAFVYSNDVWALAKSKQ